MPFRTSVILGIVVLSATACRPKDPPPAQYGQNYPGQYNPGQYQGPGQYPNGQAPNGQYPPPGTYPPPGQYPPGQYPPQQQQPQNPNSQLPVGPPNPNDPINTVDINWLRSNAGSVMGELIAALSPDKQAKVQNIPFVADPTPGEVNAFAACDDQGQPLMAITDGLLEIEAYISQLRATDELYGTHKLNDYENMIAQGAKPHQPLPRPAPGFIDPTQSADGRKVARQHVLMDEQLAFVLGHELGHHYLGHTGCANGSGSRGASPADLARIATKMMPVFNQGNEVQADIAGVNSTLSAGAKRQGAHWNEEGGLMTMDFFAILDQLSPASIIFAFQASHPHPLVRKPIIQQAANTWRATGGTGIQFPTIPGLFGG